MQNQTLKVEGMSCNHCVNSIEGALRNIGVTAKVDLKNGTVQVQYDENNVNLEKIKHEIEEQGYDVV
ncbi:MULTISPECIES: copper chaperone CopZ [Paenibacillaceae]|uniref:Copper chaperone CopZ n=1 Tax=Marinicrinis lubricantis TaxID=2086470 RepID=A0ABW1IUC3_9BACL|nr:MULTISPECIES: copper chaperone CopZ [Paenibacillus]MED4599720.1 copper chaperone CopZ [Paenibacillus validus]MED4604847.1 copper chaperone CopZ [Paenibacillus validus]NTZ19084.1 copper chaperone CopZ [Paenibacillus sp. JMULE4]